MPGHGDWEQGEPEIMVTDGPCDNTMNPTKDATYKFLAKFLKEVTTIFPEQNLFLGARLSASLPLCLSCLSVSLFIRLCLARPPSCHIRLDRATAACAL